MAFSKESLLRIKKELDAVPLGANSDFSMSLDTDEIRAHYCWSEGIKIRCQTDGRYICTWHLERSAKTYEIPTEAEAVEKFISVARSAKSENCL